MNENYYSWLALDATVEEFIEEVSSIVERPNNGWIVEQLESSFLNNLDIMNELSKGEDKKSAFFFIDLITKN